VPGHPGAACRAAAPPAADPCPPGLPRRRPALRQQLAAADKDAVYPLLKWVLAQPELLRKRAFVGYYLSLPEVRARARWRPAGSGLRAPPGACRRSCRLVCCVNGGRCCRPGPACLPPSHCRPPRHALARPALAAPAQLPDELQYDPDVMELREGIRQLQQQFVEAHKVAEAAQAGTK
jgi:hypothetical protein